MIAPETVEAIAHLDWEVPCSTQGCPGEPARWRVQCRSCAKVFLWGDDCRDYILSRESLFVAYCDGCNAEGASIDDIAWVVPL